MSKPPTRFSTYAATLKHLSIKTGTPLPSLILSFGILHELTAVVPLIGIFYASRALGVGEGIVNAVINDTDTEIADGSDSKGVRWGKEKVRTWVEEGDKWAVRVGKRYGLWGYEKWKNGEEGVNVDNLDGVGHRIVGDVANAVVAYGTTKALLPVRIGASMYFAPAFSRRVLDPVRRAVVGVFRKPKP